MLISNLFIYLFNTLCSDFLTLCKDCVKKMIRKVVVIRFSHRTQCFITTSVDIMFIVLTTEYYVQKQIFIEVFVTQQSAMRHFLFFFFFGKKRFSPILADMEGCRNKVFSSQAMSHYFKLRCRAFGVSFFLRFSVHLIRIFQSRFKSRSFVL